jgi:hypothetical protein
VTYLFPLQLSATIFTELASSVFEAVAFAVAPVDDPDALLALASPCDAVLGALASALLLAEAEAVDATVPITSTSLFRFELSCDSSPCTL